MKKLYVFAVLLLATVTVSAQPMIDVLPLDKDAWLNQKKNNAIRNC